MSSVYDNWERLVEATLKREDLRQLALCSSFSSSSRSDDSRSSFSSFEIYSHLADHVPERLVIQLLEKPITYPHISEKSISLADQVINAADLAVIFKQECAQLKSQAEKLACLLRLEAHAGNNHYARLVISDIERVLDKALVLLRKCSANGRWRLFTIIPSTAFPKMFSQLQDSIGNVSWLLKISAGFEGYIGLLPFACSETLAFIKLVLIAILSMGSMEDRSDAAGNLVNLFRHDYRWGKLFIGKGGVLPLLELMRVGELEGWQNAARSIGLLGNDPINIEQMIQADVCLAFLEMLKRSPTRVQAVFASGLIKFSEFYPNYQRLVAQPGFIQLLIRNLRGVLMSNKSSNDISVHLFLSGESNGAQEMENPMARAQIKVVALRALQNRPIYRSIIKSGTLLSFAILLKNDSQEVRHHSAMALMEITAVAEGDAKLKSAFNPDSPACKAVVDQLIIVVSKAESKLLIPCIKTIGNLARNFRAEGARMMSLLVNLLGNGEAEVDSEVCATLTKFICHENYLHRDYSKIIVSIGGMQHLHRDYSKIIVSIGGVQHLVQLVYFGEKIVKKRALAVVCYIALHVPDSEDIAQAFTVLRWAAKKAWLMEDKYMCTLLQVAEGKLSLYKS